MGTQSEVIFAIWNLTESVYSTQLELRYKASSEELGELAIQAF
jgi:hypothetical protein